MDGTNGFSHIKQQIGERIVCRNVHAELVYNKKKNEVTKITSQYAFYRPVLFHKGTSKVSWHTFMFTATLHLLLLQ